MAERGIIDRTWVGACEPERRRSELKDYNATARTPFRPLLPAAAAVRLLRLKSAASAVARVGVQSCCHLAGQQLRTPSPISCLSSQVSSTSPGEPGKRAERVSSSSGTVNVTRSTAPRTGSHAAELAVRKRDRAPGTSLTRMCMS